MPIAARTKPTNGALGSSPSDHGDLTWTAGVGQLHPDGPLLPAKGRPGAEGRGAYDHDEGHAVDDLGGAYALDAFGPSGDKRETHPTSSDGGAQETDSAGGDQDAYTDDPGLNLDGGTGGGNQGGRGSSARRGAASTSSASSSFIRQGCRSSVEAAG